MTFAFLLAAASTDITKQPVPTERIILNFSKTLYSWG